MKILHVVPMYLPAWRYGGIISSVHGLCKGLAERGHDVHVFTTSIDGKKDSDVRIDGIVEVDGVKIHYFKTPFLRRLCWAPSMKNALNAEIESFDLVHLHTVYLWPTSAAARVASKKSVPYLVATRGMLVPELVRMKSYWVKMAWIRFIEKKTIENSEGIHVTSRIEQKELSRFSFRLPSVHIVPNGTDIPDIVKSVEASPSLERWIQKKPFILYLGRVNWEKGLDRLIAALAAVDSLNLLVVGNDEKGYISKLQKLAADSGVSPRVFFTGPLYGMEKRALIEAASFLVLPSLSESFGNVVLEAMILGCPVVVSKGVGMAEAVQNSGAGLVVSGDSTSLSEAFRKMVSDPIRLKKMGECGRQAALKEFSWDSVAEKMERVYKKMVNGAKD